MKPRLPLLALALGATALATAALLWPRPAPRPDVFLFTVDTLRADHSSVYGHHRPTTPWLESVAAEGVVYEQCVSASSWTVPSLVALHTGAYPWTLGMHEAPSLSRREKGVEHPVIPDSVTTLAERFAAAGYATRGLTANKHLVPDFGWAQGFGGYKNVGWGSVDRLERQRGVLAAPGGQPRFVWVHLFDPHDPFQPRPDLPWQTGAEAWAAVHGDPSVVHAKLEASEALKTPEGVEVLRALYDGEIYDADRWLGHLEEALEVGPEDVLVFASDHGEEFQERGHFGHRRTLFEESVRVPCVIRGPGFAPGRESRPVDLLDLHATALAAAGIEADTLGRDLRHFEDRPVFAQLTRGAHELWAVWRGADKQIESTRGAERYALEADPGEASPLPADPALSALLRELRTAHPEGEAVYAQSAEAEALEALGYVEP